MENEEVVVEVVSEEVVVEEAPKGTSLSTRLAGSGYGVFNGEELVSEEGLSKMEALDFINNFTTPETTPRGRKRKV